MMPFYEKKTDAERDFLSVNEMRSRCASQKNDKDCQAVVKSDTKAQFCQYLFPAGNTKTNGVCEVLEHLKTGFK